MSLLLSICHGKEYDESALFVGERKGWISVFYGKPELPQEAPAVIELLGRRYIDNFGFRKLSELLSTAPGFFYTRGKGTDLLLLRGISSGTLFAFDGIPLATDSTRAIYPLGEELSLDYVKTVEVTKGPASTLWGPDAYAGVVNIVPFRGRDINKILVKGTVGSPYKDKAFSVVYGLDRGTWDALIFAKHCTTREDPGKSHREFSEGLVNLYFGDSLNILGRFSIYRRPIKLYYDGRTYHMRKDNPFALLKASYKKRIKHVSLEFKSAYLDWNIVRKMDRLNLGHRNREVYLEGRSSIDFLDNRAMLTLGASVRKNWVKNAVVESRGFLLDYLEQSTFAPLIYRDSFQTTLFSVFSQIIAKGDHVTAWLGARWDDHSDYKGETTYTAGISFHPRDSFYLKLAGGTAYRTPFSYQFLKKRERPEKLTSINAEAAFKIGKASFKVSPFYNHVKRYVSEDDYGGYSLPLEYHTYGLEAALSLRLRNFKSWIATTFLGSDKSAEKFRILKYAIATPEGIQKFYEERKRPVFVGPKQIISAGAIYRWGKTTIALKGLYASHYHFKYLHTKKSFRIDPSLLIDLYISHRLTKRVSISMKAENILNKKDRVMGLLEPVREEGTRFLFTVSVSF